MRLTKLKLAGFKSFVDPTTVLLPGQLVGVVGPNGCGKSNIMDAVRWVLGESRATELRGESMQDVIFNGSGQRKPVGRASVELVFDNSLGRLSGQWSAYPEIAVKRVLDREGNSSYQINNLQVRRKDVIDLFLGTGLGPRAYAIIGQGMISRIIEARPEDLRLFLEEAAGVSKYKERRRETEHRLEDARENLLRLEDIRSELASRIVRLDAQAEVAREYRRLEEGLVRAQSLLWYVRRHNARLEQLKLAQEREQTATDLEGRISQLRAQEAALENLRQDQFAAVDALQARQGELYAANAEVSRIEGELKHLREGQQRLAQRQARLAEEAGRWTEQLRQLAQEQAHWQAQAEQAGRTQALAQTDQESAQAQLPERERLWQEVENQHQEARNALSRGEQRLRVAETQTQAAARNLLAQQQRRERLQGELQALPVPDLSGLAEKNSAQAEAEAELQARQIRIQELNAGLPEARQQLNLAQAAEQALRKRETETRARRDALLALQARIKEDASTEAWQQRHGLTDRAPLWRHLKVDVGWERALEAVLREGLAARLLEAEELAGLLADPLAANLSFGLRQWSGQSGAPSLPGSLYERLQCSEPAWDGVLRDWLGSVVAVEDLPELGTLRGAHGGGQSAVRCYVNRQGQILSATALRWHGPDARTHGVLERQEEIAALNAALQDLRVALAEASQGLGAAEAALNQQQDTLSVLRRDAQAMQQAVHSGQMALLKLAEARQRYEERHGRLHTDLAEVDSALAAEQGRLSEAQQACARHRQDVEAARQSVDGSARQRQAQEGLLRQARGAAQQAAARLQDARFRARECATRLQELARNQAILQEQLGRCGAEQAALHQENAGLDAQPLEGALQEALTLRSAKENALAESRNAAESAASRLKLADQARLSSEQALAPLRDRLGELKLKEQAAELQASQWAARLAESGQEEGRVAAWAAEPGCELRDNRLNGEINRLNNAVAALGAVNLAALEELSAARQRKDYLDSQFADLSQAISTLEDAIRRIDRETRAQLQGTYDQVNAGFARLFPELFGGGEARLILSGDEILDAGIQVMAQPPGKKNSTIHLLSGGEKALTAIALVFSIFQLNPAPFCLLDEVDAPLDDTNTERFCEMVKRMSRQTQFLYISHNKITMEMAQQLVGVTMQESGVSRVVEVDIEEALKLRDEVAA